MTDALPLDADASRVLRAARELAVERGEGKISPHVLLVALARTGGVSVQSVLHQYGFNPDEAEDWVNAKVGPLRSRSAFEEESPLFTRTQLILGMAAIEAQDAGADAVRPRDLLLGLLREPNAAAGIAGAALIEQGASYDALRAALA